MFFLLSCAEQQGNSIVNISERNRLFLIPSVEPERLQNVMPSSWHRLERLTSAEEQTFLEENISTLLQIESTLWDNEYFSIYREQAGKDTFYRILLTTEYNPDYKSSAIQFRQLLMHRNTILLQSWYTTVTDNPTPGFFRTFYSLDIISGNDGAKGVLLTRMTVAVRNRNLYNWSSTASRRNGRLFGNNHSRFFSMYNLLNRNLSSFLRIDASDCLVDPAVPMRFSLQNAFDNDPSTSFVANSTDNSLIIDLGFMNHFDIRQIAIINGYAQSSDAYFRYNRVKEIVAVTDGQFPWVTDTDILFDPNMTAPAIPLGVWLLEDNTLNHQFINIEAPVRIRVSDVFSGSVYNFTAIAELNFFTVNGWLFNDINQ